MPALTIRNLPEETHRALRVRAAEHGRSTEAEIRDILEKAARPEGRVKLGSLLVAIGREAGFAGGGKFLDSGPWLTAQQFRGARSRCDLRGRTKWLVDHAMGWLSAT